MSLDCELHDIRDNIQFTKCLDPHSYKDSHHLAYSIRQTASDGITYPSVRHKSGTCAALFWPDVAAKPILGQSLGYYFNGETITQVKEETEDPNKSIKIYKLAD